MASQAQSHLLQVTGIINEIISEINIDWSIRWRYLPVQERAVVFDIVKRRIRAIGIDVCHAEVLQGMVSRESVNVRAAYSPSKVSITDATREVLLTQILIAHLVQAASRMRCRVCDEILE
ncbi:hypothetical protein PM082_012396 [Marasmius tenuissimus]|nr:hypothetical protein PM082_012396 [Marasmius tenuissimus]